MLLGPVFGAVADRWSRRWCMVVADVVRAVAFLGIVLVDDFDATVAWRSLAGTGTGAVHAGLARRRCPASSSEERLPAATSLYGAIADLGFTAGPGARRGRARRSPGPRSLLVVNGVTFALSAVIVRADPVRRGRGREPLERGRCCPSLLREAREGCRRRAPAGGRAGRRSPASAAALFFGGAFNVGELLFATDVLDASDAGYSVLVALFGLGFIGGSLAGSRGGAAACCAGASCWASS